MNKFMRKLWAKKESKKGFTLVELIVVLVILAILAAIMVPSLLGWIDKAKEKQRVLEARSVYMAMQAKASEKYATDTTKTEIKADSFDSDDISEIQTMADITDLAITSVTVEDTSTDHGKYTITGCVISFKGTGDTNSVTMTLKDGTWTEG